MNAAEGPLHDPRWRMLDDADLDLLAGRLMEGRPHPVPFFAYGSLIPADEDSLIRHCSLSAADRLEIDLRRGEHNKFGFAVQLCAMRHPGRALSASKIPPRAMLNFIAGQISADPTAFAIYAHREETRRDHIARLMIYLGVRSATAQDRRAGLSSAIEAAAICLRWRSSSELGLRPAP